MTLREAVLKTRQWVEAQIEKAKKPFQDPFQLTSLQYAVEQAAGPMDDHLREEVFELLHRVAVEERMRTYDVATPYGAIFVLNRALAKC